MLRWRRLTASAVARGATYLDDSDRARRDRFTHEDARDHMVASRGLLGDGLASVGFTLGEMTRLPKGKPQLIGGPPFNLSHSHGALALAVVTPAAVEVGVEVRVEVGVDVEAPWRKTDFDAVSRRFFAESESRTLEQLPDEARRVRFFELWTLKEAVLKATGKGLTQPLASVVFELNENWELKTKLPGAWSLGQWHLETGHLFAAALQAPHLDSAQTLQVEWDGPVELPVIREQS